MILSLLTTFLIFGLTISLLVFIHEGGHFLVAKRARVWVHEFAIGFGPAIWRRKKGETEYTFRILPLGGFVRMAGEDAKSEDDQAVPKDRLFSSKSPFTRIAIIFAGPLANMLFAILMMVIFISSFGVPFVEIGEINASSPAAGVLRSGDKILNLNNEEIYFTEQVQGIIQKTKETPIDAVIERNGQQQKVTLKPYYDKEMGRYLIGVFFNFPLNRVSGVPSESALATQGILKADDVILAVNGVATPTWPEVMQALNQALDQGGLVSLKIQRGKEFLAEVPFDAAITNKDEIKKITGFSIGITSTQPIVERVAADSYMHQKGLRAGDRLVSANSEEISTLTSLIKEILRAQGMGLNVELKIDRAGVAQSLQLDVTGRDFVDLLQGMQLKSAQRKPSGILMSISIGFKRIIDTLNQLWLGILQIFRGQTNAGDAFRGPVGIANILGQSLNQGFDRFFQLVTLLSLVLGVFNLVPFPALDGSRILFIFVELLRGKPISPEKEGWVHYIGFILLMGLIVLITWQDIQRILRGGI